MCERDDWELHAVLECKRDAFECGQRGFLESCRTIFTHELHILIDTIPHKITQVLGLSMTGDPGLTRTNITELDTIISVFDTVVSDLSIESGCFIQVDLEIMLVTGVLSSSQIMVQRAQEKTGAVRHSANSPLAVVGLRYSYGYSYTIGLTVGGPIVPSSRLFPLASRYETHFTPKITGNYQVHSSLAQGSGFDATFYYDKEGRV